MNYSETSNGLISDSEQRLSEVIDVEVESSSISVETIEEAPEKLTNIELY